MSTCIVSTIGGRRTGGDDGCASTWRCEEDEVVRGFLRRVTGVGLSEPSSASALDPASSSLNEVVAPAGWHAAKNLARDGVP